MSQTLLSLAGFQVILIGWFWGSSSLLVKDKGNQGWRRYHRVSGMLWKHDGCWASWEAEVIFRQRRASSAAGSCGAAPAEALEKRVYGAEGLEIATQRRPR